MKKQMCVVSLVLLAVSSWASATTWYPTSLVSDGDFSVAPTDNGWILAQGSASTWWWQSGSDKVTLRRVDSTTPSLLDQQVTGLTAGVQYKLSAETDYWGNLADAPWPDWVDWVYQPIYLRVFNSSGTLINEACRTGGNEWKPLDNVFTAPSDGVITIELTSTATDRDVECYWKNVVLSSSVPEPATLSLLSLCGLALLRRKK
jgi:hypothetical protein